MCVTQRVIPTLLKVLNRIFHLFKQHILWEIQIKPEARKLNVSVGVVGTGYVTVVAKISNLYHTRNTMTITPKNTTIPITISDKSDSIDKWGASKSDNTPR